MQNCVIDIKTNKLNSNLTPELEIVEQYDDNSTCGSIINADVTTLLHSLPENYADLIFLDPPFNLGKDYGNGKNGDRKPLTDYMQWLSAVIRDSCRVLSDGGALYFYHLPETASHVTPILNSLLQFRHWIAISMKSSFVRGPRLYPAHYALLYYTKGTPKTFTRPRLKPQQCRHCGNYVKDYGGYRSIIEEKGINLSDIWDDLSPVRHKNKKHRTANELPSLLFERIITISGEKGGIYVDPFAGSGTGVITAIRAHMHFIAGEISKEYCELIAKRIAAEKQGE